MIHDFETILNTVQTGIYVYSIKEGKNTYINQRYTKLLGYTLEEINAFTSEEFFNLFHPDDREDISQHMDEVAKLKKGEVSKMEYRFKSKNAGWRWCLSQDTGYQYDQAGVLISFIGSFWDVTSYKDVEINLLKAKKKLELSEYNLKRAQTISHLGIWYLDIETNEVQWTEELYKMYGFDPHLPPPPYTEHMKLFTPESWELLSNSLANTQETGLPYELELNTIKQDGSKGWMWVRGEAKKDCSGKVVGLWGAAQDITQHKEIELSLSEAKYKAEQSETQFRRLFENMEQGFALHQIIDDENGHPIDYRLILANKAFEKLTGINSSECVGKTILEIIPNLEHEWIEKYGRVAKLGKTLQFENYVEAFEKYYSVVAYSPQKDFFATVFTDVTDVKKYQQLLVKEKEDAERSNYLKSTFLANMSHEIRTPMNAIIGFASFLKDQERSKEEIDGFADIIIKAGNHLLNLINDVIDISKIDAGQLEVFKENVNVNKLVKEVFRFFQSEMLAKNNFNIHLQLHLPSEDLIVSTDETRLNQILINLVSNAIKFTERGKVEFGCEKNGNQLDFYVRDTGIGISKDEQELIFERFQQANPITEKLYGGTGLGLAIAKACVHLLGGELKVDSEPGKGSNFYFSIIYEPAELKLKEKEPKQIKHGNFNNELVLVAEDDEVSYQYLVEILKNCALSIIRTTTGRSTIKEAISNNQIKLILMDINMPDLSGDDATIEIRKHKPNLPIIAQTAYAMSGDKSKFIGLGCNDYLSKPINPQDLINMLEKYLQS